MKVCSKCGSEKSLDSFNPGKGKMNRVARCKTCTNEYFRSRKDKSREYRLKNLEKEKIAIEKYQSKMKPGVYILHTDLGDYVGESIKMKRRVGNHKEWNKDSPVKTQILSWEILEVIEDTELRKQREQYWIEKLQPELNKRDYHWGSKYVL